MTPELISALHDLCNFLDVSDCQEAEFSCGTVYVTKKDGSVMYISGGQCEE